MATTLTAAALRRELAALAITYATAHSRLHPHESTYGSIPNVVFQPGEETHGNFHPDSYRAILANPAWSARLTKVYTSTRRIPHHHHPDRNRTRRELDCASSSDALLMNIFCHPAALTTPAVRALLGLRADEAAAELTFGYHPRLPLLTLRAPKARRKNSPLPVLDRTEIDLHLSPLLVEAKLTESDFQRAPLSAVERYPAFSEIFDLPSLPITTPLEAFQEEPQDPQYSPAIPKIQASDDDRPWTPEPDLPPNLSTTNKPKIQRQPILHSYQLVRGVLAAHHEDKRFVVLCDRRRADLIERWFQILRAIRPYELRSRCALLTWQELAATLPITLQHFLETKYGIHLA